MIGFWIAAALLTAAVVILLARPLMRKSAAADMGGTDLAVYRDQLAELEREKARGLVEAEQAAAMETEISRRMLNASREAQPAVATTAPSRALTMLLAVLFPIGGLVIYLSVGQPDMPGLPLAERQVSQQQDPAKVLAAVDEIKGRLKQTKDDLDRWVMVAEAYEKLGHPREAVETFRIAKQISPDDPGISAGLGEALINADGGAVGEEAKKLFEAIPPDSDAQPEARYYLAMAAAQAGDMKTALRGWQSLMSDSPADASWIEPTRERIKAASFAMGLDPEKETPNPKPAAAMAAAQPGAGETPLEGGPDTEDQQRQMIEGMVAKLAARLEANPDDADGWRRLARAYQVMGQMGKAKDAMDHAAAADAKAAGAPAPAGPVSAGPVASGPVAPENAPNSAAGQAIQQMSPEEQNEMIQGMVSKLAAKLEANPDDADGWRRLARAYQVLGQNDKAKTALDRAAAADAKAGKK
jgi:cytochrome c-type biogenesis protein CcmH